MKRKETKEDFFQVVAVPNNLCDLHCDLLRKVMRVLLSVRAQEKRKKNYSLYRYRSKQKL